MNRNTVILAGTQLVHIALWWTSMIVGYIHMNMPIFPQLMMWLCLVIAATHIHRLGHDHGSIFQLFLYVYHQFQGRCQKKDTTSDTTSRFYALQNMSLVRNYWWWGKWHHVHARGHHVDCFPISDFVRPDYRRNPVPHAAKIQNVSYLFGITVLLLLGSIILDIRWNKYQLLYFLTCTGFFVYLEEYIHVRIHTHDSWLEKYEWFQILRQCHKAHHAYPYRVNYSVAALWSDMLQGSFSMGIKNIVQK